MRRTRTMVLCTLAATALTTWAAVSVAALEKETSLVTKQPIGNLAVAGRLSVDLHAEFMASRSYGTETVLNWYNCGYSGGGRATSVGGTFGNFGLDVPYTQREKKYPHAVTIDKVRAIRFDGGDIMKGNFAVEKAIAGPKNMALEIWLRADQPSKSDIILGWQSKDGKQTSATIGYPEGFKGSDKWRHIVVNCTPDKEDWYLDGVKVGSGKRSTTIKDGHIMVLGGASADKPSFKGDLVAVRLHDDTMTSEEIDHNFKGGVMLGTEMHSWWRNEPDKWFVVESEHFRQCIDKEAMAGWSEQQMNDFKKRAPGMLNLAELLYHTYSERLALRSSVVSRRPQMRGDGIKYKTPIQPSVGSWMGVDDDFGWACQGEGFINPHELVHGWDAMTGGMAGNFWEVHANFPQIYNGYYQTIPVIMAEASAFPASGRTYYHDRLMFEHLAHTPEYGPMFISKLWYDGPTKEEGSPYPWIAFNQINPYPEKTLADEYIRMAMKNVTWDYVSYAIAEDGKGGNTPYGNDGVAEPESRYRREAERSKADVLRYSRVLLEKIPYSPEWWRVPKEQAPQQLGWNICPLKFKPGKVTATLAGYYDAKRGGDWRAAFVGVDADGYPVYGKAFKPGQTQSFTAKSNIKELYLVVCATPRLMSINMVGDFRSFEQEQFPYKVKLTGCQPLDVMVPAAPTVAGSKHPNGGGFVENTAQVAATAYVGANAQVLGKSVVMGNARIGDYAVIKDATVRDNAIVAGHALVCDGSTVAENAKVRGYAVVKGRTTVKGNAKILEHAAIFTQKTCTDNAVVKGVASVYGGNQGGTAMIDGFYAKGNEITRGKWFTWSWGAGKNDGEIDEEFGGLYADYDFEQSHGWMAKDAFAATWGYLVNNPKFVVAADREKRKSILKKPEAILPKLEVPINTADHYAESLSGYILPPATGDYTFWIAGDEEAQLFIGEAGAAKATKKICEAKNTAPAEFTRQPEQKSAIVRLEKGKAYPVLVLHAEDVHGDHIAVAWTKPGSDKPEIIGSENLSVTADGKQPGVRQRVWNETTKIADLLKRADYPSGTVRVSGQVLVLNGKDQFVELQEDVADMRNCTYTADFKWDGVGNGARLFEFANPGGSAMWLSPSENGKLVFAIQRGKTIDRVTAPAAKKGVWTTVQAIIDGKTASLYVNGKKVAENKNMTLTPDSVRATECYLGRGIKGNYFGGSVERFTVHSVALIDSTPPTPNPPTFVMAPVFTSPDTLVLTATPGIDPLGNVDYYFEEEGGSWNSGWTKDNVLRVTGKDASKPAKYRFKVRDLGGNETKFSESAQAEWVAATAKVFDAGIDTTPTVIEAESYAVNAAGDGATWELKSTPTGYAGRGAMQVLPDKGANIDPARVNTARMDYLVNFTKPGRYFVWLRGHGVNPSGDSINMGIDMKIDNWGNNIQVGRDYAWDGRREFHIDKPGIHRFSIWMREDGAMIDRILFTTEGGYEPGSDKRSATKALIGEGPAESPSHTLTK